MRKGVMRVGTGFNNNQSRLEGIHTWYDHAVIKDKTPLLPKNMGVPFIKRFINWWKG